MNDAKNRSIVVFFVFLLLPDFCSAVSLYQAVRRELFPLNVNIIFSAETLRKIQTISDAYEIKILGNIQHLGTCFMQDLLVFLKQDALSPDAINAKVLKGGYGMDAYDYESRYNASFYVLEFAHQPSNKILCKFIEGMQHMQYISTETLNVFQEADKIFRQFVQDCSVDNKLQGILRHAIRKWYDDERAWQFKAPLHDMWCLVANASGGQ